MAPAMNRFESVVILDSGKTYLKHRCHIIMFESVVILDSGKTIPCVHRSLLLFESVVILDSGKQVLPGSCQSVRLRVL